MRERAERDGEDDVEDEGFSAVEVLPWLNRTAGNVRPPP